MPNVSDKHMPIRCKDCGHNYVHKHNYCRAKNNKKQKWWMFWTWKACSEKCASKMEKLSSGWTR